MVSRRVKNSIANGIKVLSPPTAVVQKQISLYSFLTGSCCFSYVDALFLSFFFLFHTVALTSCHQKSVYCDLYWHDEKKT